MRYFKQTVAVITALCLLSIFAPPARALTIKEEKDLAAEFLKAVRSYYPIIDDAMIQDYVENLGQSIVAKIPPQPFDYHFYVIQEDTINAFAGPAGNIFIFSGLFEAMESESALAGILAHEIAHVSARHISDIIEKSKKTNMATMAGLIAGILIGLGGASAPGSAMAIGSMAAGQTAILAYTRENEIQADYLGRSYLQSAGYDLYGLRNALKKIRAQEWYGEEQIPTYLKTHPATRDRLANIESILRAREEEQPETTYAFERTRARLMALYSNPADAVDRFNRILNKGPNNPTAAYGLALALSEAGRPEAAIDHMKTALSKLPDDPYLMIDMGRLHFMAGDYEAAKQTLKGIPNTDRYGPDGNFYLGRTFLATGDYESAASIFKALHQTFPDHSRTLFFLGQSYGEQGQLTDAHYYLGLYYRKIGEHRNAYFHFNQAIDHTDDPDRKAEIRKELEQTDVRQPAPEDQKNQNRLF